MKTSKILLVPALAAAVFLTPNLVSAQVGGGVSAGGSAGVSGGSSTGGSSVGSSGTIGATSGANRPSDVQNDNSIFDSDGNRIGTTSNITNESTIDPSMGRPEDGVYDPDKYDN